MAEVLSAREGVHAVSERTTRRTGGKRCDVEIRRKHGDRYYTVVECKIGQNVSQRKAAVKDVQRWLKRVGVQPSLCASQVEVWQGVSAERVALSP